MKRSQEPIFWLMFGAGGVLSALFGPVLILITGILVPLGLLLPEQTMDYGRVLALARNPLGKLAVLAVIVLFLFHGCHRMRHSLHDLGYPTGTAVKALFYGGAATASLSAAYLLLAIGF